MRKAAAQAAVNDMCSWFRQGLGTIAILDATNSTKARRRWIIDRCNAEGIEALFVESKCDDEEIIMNNILEVKTTSPDYIGQDPEVAAADFLKRIRNYEKVYQTIDEDEADMTYVKIINVGKQVIINRIQDYLQSRVVYYLMNLHIRPRSIWLSRVRLVPLRGAKYFFPRAINIGTQLTFGSTANPNTTSKLKSEATQTSRSAVKHTPARCQISSANQLATAN